MTNERLRKALASKGMTPSDLAAVVEVDPKRWIAGSRSGGFRINVIDYVQLRP
jgi:hypothetical protein